jgi:hypothetical protein
VALGSGTNVGSYLENLLLELAPQIGFSITFTDLGRW